jgi:hypothetical protein
MMNFSRSLPQRAVLAVNLASRITQPELYNIYLYWSKARQ